MTKRNAIIMLAVALTTVVPSIASAHRGQYQKYGRCKSMVEQKHLSDEYQKKAAMDECMINPDNYK